MPISGGSEMELIESIKNFAIEQSSADIYDKTSFDMMSLGKRLNDYLPLNVQQYIYHEIIDNPHWAKDAILKKKEIDRIVRPYGLERWFSGTNRMVYKVNYDDRVVIKIPFKHSGLPDAGKEMVIQHFLKPFVPKVFDVGYNGVASLNERIYPIRNREEFHMMRGMHFEMMRYFKKMGFFINDAGVRAFINFGIRENFGLVFCDFPEVYKALDGLRCKRCGGKIGYTPCFDKIQCRSCNKDYNAQEVAAGTIQSYFYKQALRQSSQNAQNNSKGGTHNMRVQILSFGEDGVTCLTDTGVIGSTKTVQQPAKKSAADFKKKAVKHMVMLPPEVKIQKDPVSIIGTKNNPGKKTDTPLTSHEGKVITNDKPSNKKTSRKKDAEKIQETPVSEEPELQHEETSPLITPSKEPEPEPEQEEAAIYDIDPEELKGRKDGKKKREVDRKKKKTKYDEEFDEEDF